ncbi:MAG: proteasome accessory factor PafA2 family protein [Candidatus Brennerbacteria bacterium]|nr:proteasome accessory factor PafA2 family protein [Candidatus Brennerbacteria bacterium]
MKFQEKKRQFARSAKGDVFIRRGMDSGDLIENIEKNMEYEQLAPSRKYCANLNNFLFNGGRCYKDGEYLELATPECSGIDELINYEKAMEANLLVILKKINKISSSAAVNDSLARYSFFEVNKKSTDFQKSTGSAGSHENYHIELTNEWKSTMNTHSRMLYDILLPYLFSRSFFIGSGHLDNNGFFLASPRLLVTKNLFLMREDNNSGDVDGNHVRLQVCLSDANMSSFCVKFRFGPTHIILRMIEEGFLKKPIINLDNQGLAGFEAIEGNVFKTCLLANGQRVSFLEINRLYFAFARKFFETVLKSEEEVKIMKMWEECLDNVEKNQSFFDKIVDWRIIYRFLTAVLEKKYNLSWEDLQRDLNSDELKTREKTSSILTALQALNLRYFSLTDNRIRLALCETGFLDISLKFPENYFDSPLRFNPPATRAEWRLKALKFFSDNPVYCQYKTYIYWGRIEMKERYNLTPSISLSNYDPLNPIFVPPL